MAEQGPVGGEAREGGVYLLVLVTAAALAAAAPMEAAGDVAAAWLRRLQEGGVEVAAAAELVRG